MPEPSTSHIPADSRPARTEASLQDVVALVLEQRRFAIGVPVALALVVCLATLLWPRSYTATSAFVPQSTSSPALGRLAGLAAQFGVAVPAQDPAQSPEFYAELLVSDALLRLVVDSALLLPRADAVDTVLLRAELGGQHRDPELQAEYSIERLRKRLEVSTTLKTGVVRVSARTTDAGLSAAIVERLLRLVNGFNLETRQSQARQQRRFLEDRLKEARQDLRDAEDAEQGFLQRNREFRSSPQLTFEHNRLERTVTQRQEIVTTLSQAYEQSRIEEVRDTPLITIIQSPAPPARPDRRLLLVKTLLTFMAGCGLAVLLILWRATLTGSEWKGRASRGRIAALWQETKRDLRAPSRLLRRAQSPDVGPTSARPGE